MNQTYASYQPGTFTIDVSQFTPGETLFVPEDMPAFLHEYCHYLQDITTISGIFGFSLWMRDLVDLTRIFSDGEGKTILLPLGKNENDQPINQYRRFYNIFCGNAEEVLDLDYRQVRFERVVPEEKPITIGDTTIQVRLNRIYMHGRAEPLQFRLIALQEMHACYAQQLAERHYLDRDPTLTFTVPAAGLASYPYHFGDHLLEVFEVTMPLDLKFIFIGLCLDTIQAPSVFLTALEAIRGKTFTTEDRSVEDLILMVEQVRRSCSYSNEEALANILPDLQKWSTDFRRPDLATGLMWYTSMVMTSSDLKKSLPIGFNGFFCQGINELVALYASFPAPAFYNNSRLDGQHSANGDAGQDLIFNMAHEAASSFWLLWKLYDFLCSPDIDTLMKKCKCPLYDPCTVRSVLNEEYTCFNSPWEIVKGKTTIPCAYGRTVTSIGLWQNSIDFNFNK
jgi:hypothetical protein